LSTSPFSIFLITFSTLTATRINNIMYYYLIAFQLGVAACNNAWTSLVVKLY
jgi:hypothetical protein